MKIIWPLVLVIIGAATVGCTGSSVNQQVINDYNSYINLINSDVSKLNETIKKYPAQMKADVFAQYVNEYGTQLSYYKQHLIEFRTFVTKNENELKKAGINPIKERGDIDARLSQIDFQAKELERKINQLQADEQMKRNLLGLLGKLLL